MRSASEDKVFLLGKTLVTIFAISLLFGLSIQYPASSTFPIGGDAPRYINRAIEITKEPTKIISNSSYPLAIATTSFSQILPTSWPTRFIWLMTLAHIGTGLVVGFVLFRRFNTFIAAIGIATWALTTVVNPHFEDGTLAQLLSLPLLILFLDRFAAGSFFTSALLLTLTFFMHPFSGFLALIIPLISVPIVLLTRRKLSKSHVKNIAIVSIIALVGLVIFVAKRDIGELKDPDIAAFSILNLVKSPIGPIAALSGIGAVIAIKNRRNTIFAITIISLLVLGGLFMKSGVTGYNLQPNRFQTYFILASSILGSIGLGYALKTDFLKPGTKIIITTLLFAILATQAWLNASKIYAYYESPAKYARIHPDEEEAMYWLRDATKQQQTILTSNINRHHEWVPILTHHKVLALPENDPIWQNPKNSADYILILRKREKTPDHLDSLPVVFQNEGAIILQPQ